MRSQDDRDVVTLNIATTLVIFTCVVAVGALILVLVNQFTEDGTLLSVLGYVVLSCASVVALVYLLRHRRP
jgi:hypothetical protein